MNGPEGAQPSGSRLAMSRSSLPAKIRRYRRIGTTVARYGFGIFLRRTHLGNVLHISLRRSPEKAADDVPVRVRKMLEELGPTFVKLGQILSTRPDLVPFPFLRELEKLQDEVSPVDGSEIQRVIEADLGKPVSLLFESFDPRPVASASIAQVHRAVLPGGEQVAVKVQRPGVQKVIEMDLQILRDMAALAERFIREARMYEPERLVREFEKMLRKELDFRFEARSIERFRKNFSSVSWVRVPKVYRQLSGRRVLTMSYVEGTKVSRVDRLRELGLDPRDIADKGVRAALKQIFEDGFFHADPHPGNLLVTDNGDICFLDFGITGSLDEDRKLELIYLFDGFLSRDADRIIQAFASMEAFDENADRREIRRAFEEIVDRYYNVPLREIRIREIMEDELEAIRTYGLHIPLDLSLLIKALITIEGVGLILDPDFDMTSRVKPFAGELLAERLKWTGLLRNLRRGISNFYFIAREIPSSIEAFLKSLKKGYINIAFEHKGLHDLTSTIDKSSNRISFSLIIAALIISSALIMNAGRGPQFMGFPLFGLLGFFISSVLGLWLVVSILKGGKF